MVALYFSVRSTLLVMLTTASRGARFTRVQNQKTFQFLSSLPRPLPALTNKGKVFWFWFGVSSPKSSVSISIYLRAFHFAFSVSTPTRGALLFEFIGNFVLREHTPPPTHSPLAFARAGCFGGGVARLWLRFSWGYLTWLALRASHVRKEMASGLLITVSIQV